MLPSPAVHVASCDCPLSGDHERTLEELRASEARYRRILETTSEGVWAIDNDGRTTFMNRRMAAMLGHRPEDLLGELASSLIVDETGETFGAKLETAGSSRRIESVLRRRDGTQINVMIESEPITDDHGQREGLLAMVSDITDQRRAEEAYVASQEALRRSEEQLRQAQKMEAIGCLAGGVAHDFNNLLSVILSYGELSLDALQAGDPMRSDMEEIVAAARRASELTRQLLAFSRRQRLAPRVMDLNATVSGMEKMMRRLLGEDVDLVLRLSDGIGMVHADPGQIEQVIMNLAVNSRDAMPRGGTLRIETNNVEVQPGSVFAGRGAPPGSYVRLDVIDTGVGMDSATLRRIFEPFFTTKSRDRGTGLGLSTVFGIIKQSAGHVSVFSEPGSGAHFEILLPHTLLAPESVATPRMGRELLRGSEVILLVEDYEQVRALTARILRHHGYRVLEARDPGEALLIAEHAGETIDLLLTDVVMPGLRGDELAARLRACRGSLRVLFMSGYPDGAVPSNPGSETDCVLLEKPIEPEPLLRAVRSALDSAPGVALDG